MENWTIEWVFIIGGVIAIIALYVKRDKVRDLLGGGGKPPSGTGKSRK